MILKLMGLDAFGQSYKPLKLVELLMVVRFLKALISIQNRDISINLVSIDSDQ
jgi:hypothetical protein